MSLQIQVYKNLTEVNRWDENTTVIVADVIGVFERKEIVPKEDINDLEHKIEKLGNYGQKYTKNPQKKRAVLSEELRTTPIQTTKLFTF